MFCVELLRQTPLPALTRGVCGEVGNPGSALATREPVLDLLYDGARLHLHSVSLLLLQGVGASSFPSSQRDEVLG